MSAFIDLHYCVLDFFESFLYQDKKDSPRGGERDIEKICVPTPETGSEKEIGLIVFMNDYNSLFLLKSLDTRVRGYDVIFLRFCAEIQRRRFVSNLMPAHTRWLFTD